jgi:hypothetical protein
VQLCDYMTLPEFRRMGIHTQLVGRNVELAKQKGADFMFAMHTKVSAEGDTHFRWTGFPALRAYTIPAAAIPMAQAASKMPVFGPLFMKRLQHRFLSFQAEDHSWPNSGKDSALYVDYNAEFLRYKRIGNSRRIIVEGVR